jgi:hypothetical protein
VDGWVPSARFEKLRQAYGRVAVFVLNLLLLLAGFNLALHFAYTTFDDLRRAEYIQGYMNRYVKRLKSAYPTFSDRDVQALVRETLLVSFSFENYTLFRDRPQRGQFVNVDERGYRHSEAQRPWPPSRDAYNVFFFGGSTAFGFALTDDSTIPSWFQRLAPRVGGKPTAVYNFSRMGYFSSQERILFEQLVLEGLRPDAAIFVDGLNDLHWRDGRPMPNSSAGAVWEPPRPAASEWPMVRLAHWLRKGLQLSPTNADAPAPGAAPEDFAAALARYLGNKSLIESSARGAGIAPVFVWQPVPSFKHEGREYRFRRSVPWQQWSLDSYVPVYQQVEEGARASAFGPAFVWCGGVQQGVQEALYIDLVHYHPRLSQLVAECIVREVRQRSLLPLDDGAGQWQPLAVTTR